MSLLDIANNYEEFLNNLEFDENGNLIGLDKIDELSNEFGEKAENVAQYIKEMDYRAEALKKEEQAIAERRKQAEAKRDNLKKYLTMCFSIVGQDRLETDKVKITFRRSEAVNITDPEQVSEDYKKIDFKVVIDKTAVKEAIKAGQTVYGAELVVNNNIQIK